jgi:ankyrin repeat protein
MCLNLAASRGQDALLHTILKEYQALKCLPLAVIQGQKSAMSYAAEHGYVHTVELLLKFKERRLRYRDRHGKNALDYAAGAGQMEMVKYLLSKGYKVDPSLKEREGEMKKLNMPVSNLLFHPSS